MGKRKETREAGVTGVWNWKGRRRNQSGPGVIGQTNQSFPDPARPKTISHGTTGNRAPLPPGQAAPIKSLSANSSLEAFPLRKHPSHM